MGTREKFRRMYTVTGPPPHMPPSSDPKRCVGARVHTRAHFSMSETDAKRTFGRAWNTRLVSGTVLSMVEDGSGKRISVSVDAMWDLPAGPKARTVNVRSITAGNAHGAAGNATEVPTPAAGKALVTDAEQDGVHRDQQLSAYSEGRLPSPPDPGDSLETVTEWTAHGILWK
jgi:hypothetical protein